MEASSVHGHRHGPVTTRCGIRPLGRTSTAVVMVYDLRTLRFAYLSRATKAA
jgi:hypothetical protein